MLFSRSGPVTWMVVFLGNPGEKYEGTRHNAGFRVGDAVAKHCGVTIRRLKNQALTAKCTLGGESVLLVKPQTFMNLSGEAVRPLADYYRIPADHVLVVSDETALPPGKIRLRAGGSAGGHNGLKNIIQCLGTDKFPRLRMGVGAPPNPEYPMIDWVLGKLRGEDDAALSDATERAVKAIEHCIRCGVESAMNQYNSK